MHLLLYAPPGVTVTLQEVKCWELCTLVPGMCVLLRFAGVWLRRSVSNIALKRNEDVRLRHVYLAKAV